jgi:hypothetical protein
MSPRLRIALIAATAAIAVSALLLIRAKFVPVPSGLATKGKGVLPTPSVPSSGTLDGSLKNHFLEELPNLYSRVVFETEEGSAFRVRMREFSLPQGEMSPSIRMTGDSFVELRAGEGRLAIDNDERRWNQETIVMARAGQAVKLINTGPREMVVRFSVLEGK